MKQDDSHSIIGSVLQVRFGLNKKWERNVRSEMKLGMRVRYDFTQLTKTISILFIKGRTFKLEICENEWMNESEKSRTFTQKMQTWSHHYIYNALYTGIDINLASSGLVLVRYYLHVDYKCHRNKYCCISCWYRPTAISIWRKATQMQLLSLVCHQSQARMDWFPAHDFKTAN